MAFGRNGNDDTATPNPSMVSGLNNQQWLDKFTVGQRAGVKVGLKEESTDVPGQRVGNQDTSQPSHG